MWKHDQTKYEIVLVAIEKKCILKLVMHQQTQWETYWRNIKITSLLNDFVNRLNQFRYAHLMSLKFVLCN